MATKCFDEEPIAKLAGIDPDDWFSEQSTTKKLRKSPRLTIEPKVLRLRPVSADSLHRLLEPSPSYARWLRVMLLRVLLDSPAVTQLSGRPSYNLLKVAEFIGFDDYERFSEGKTVSKIRSELKLVLEQWIDKGYGKKRLPKNLKKNLRELQKVIVISDLECDLLAFGVILHSESILETGCGVLGSDIASHMVPRILAAALGEDLKSVRAALDRDAKLARTGLLNLEIRGRYDLRQLVDLMTPTFSNRMLEDLKDIRSLVENFVIPSASASLTADQLSHAHDWLLLTKRHLADAVEKRRVGINVLIYGRPGSGKTEFARTLAKEIGLQLLEIKVMSSNGAPIAPLRRLRNQRISQAFFSETRSILLFDECEEIFDTDAGNDFAEDESTTPRKSWLNMTLETNRLPIVWIANTIKSFDEAYLRRFSLCFEMPAPKRQDSLRIIEDVFANQVGASLKNAFAKHDGVAPALASQVAEVLKSLSVDDCLEDRERWALTILNEKLKAQSIKPVELRLDCRDQPFDPSLIASRVELTKVLVGLQGSKSGRLCIYGPPGTGKTAFGRWVAEELGRPHLSYKASDLMGSYLGQTERNVAAAFVEAKKQSAVLQLDEVDSFLQDRSRAVRNWEVSQVNEMLTQMEQFDGIFIASTNLFENLDEASLRRFDIALKFDYLKPESASILFLQLCGSLGISASEGSLTDLAGLTNLTPGDFAQLRRAQAIDSSSSASELVKKLQNSVALKRDSRGNQIGFLRIAA